MRPAHLPFLRKEEMPEVLPLRRMIGPSLILLGLGLGSGELILWPYLSANFGLGIIWAAVVGLTMQFFLNMEVERYALARGESVFVGLARLNRHLPLWFIFSTFLGWFWPGIVAAGAKLIAAALDWNDYEGLAIGLLLLIGFVLSFGPILYRTVEIYQKVAISIGVPAILLILVFIVHRGDFSALAQGFIGRGEGYWFIPPGVPFFTFLGALAYAGAGGNLNLAQSFYVKEKGYGMAARSGRLSGLFRGGDQSVELTGAEFALTEENMGRFRRWWRQINWEHGLIFWGLGILTITALSLLSYASVYGAGGSLEGINFVLLEAKSISGHLGVLVGPLFLFIAGGLLFGTQLTVLDSTSRIISENAVLLSSTPRARRLPRLYYLFLWGQIALGVMVFLLGFVEPRQLIVIGATINALAMFAAFGLIGWLNRSALPQPLRPIWWRQLILLISFLFFAYFVAQAFLHAFRSFN